MSAIFQICILFVDFCSLFSAHSVQFSKNRVQTSKIERQIESAEFKKIKFQNKVPFSSEPYTAVSFQAMYNHKISSSGPNNLQRNQRIGDHNVGLKRCLQTKRNTLTDANTANEHSIIPKPVKRSSFCAHCMGMMKSFCCSNGNRYHA